MATKTVLRGFTRLHEGGGRLVTGCKSLKTKIGSFIFNYLRVTKQVVTCGDTKILSPCVTKSLVTRIYMKIKKIILKPLLVSPNAW
jgi:hypothetical protein